MFKTGVSTGWEIAIAECKSFHSDRNHCWTAIRPKFQFIVTFSVTPRSVDKMHIFVTVTEVYHAIAFNEHGHCLRITKSRWIHKPPRPPLQLAVSSQCNEHWNGSKLHLHNTLYAPPTFSEDCKDILCTNTHAPPQTYSHKLAFTSLNENALI